MGHGVHDTVSEHAQKLPPDSSHILVDRKNDEQPVQSRKLRLAARRQVKPVHLPRAVGKEPPSFQETQARQTPGMAEGEGKFHMSSLHHSSRQF